MLWICHFELLEQEVVCYMFIRVVACFPIQLRHRQQRLFKPLRRILYINEGIPLKKQLKLTDNDWELDEEIAQRLRDVIENIGLDEENTEHKAFTDAVVLLDEDEWE